MGEFRWSLKDIKCPHCGIPNTCGIKKFKNFDPQAHKINCWDAASQTGCKKEFIVMLRIHVSAHKTTEQVEAEKVSLVKPATIKDMKNLVGR